MNRQTPSRILKPRSYVGEKSMGDGAATIASAGATVGIGNVFSSLIHSVVRNPSLAKQSFGYVILGFARTEAIALFALMMAFFLFSVKKEGGFRSHSFNCLFEADSSQCSFYRLDTEKGKKEMFHSEAVAQFLNAGQEALSARQGALPQAPDSLPFPSQGALPQAPNQLPSQEAPPLVPDQNPFPVEAIPPAEPDLDSVKDVIKNRLLIHRLGQRGRTVSDTERTRIVDLKGKILTRMSQLDLDPFWDQHRNKLIRDYMLPPRGGEFRISVLENKLEQLYSENGTSSSIRNLYELGSLSISTDHFAVLEVTDSFMESDSLP